MSRHLASASIPSMPRAGSQPLPLAPVPSSRLCAPGPPLPVRMSRLSRLSSSCIVLCPRWISHGSMHRPRAGLTASAQRPGWSAALALLAPWTGARSAGPRARGGRCRVPRARIGQRRGGPRRFWRGWEAAVDEMRSGTRVSGRCATHACAWRSLLSAVCFDRCQSTTRQTVRYLNSRIRCNAPSRRAPACPAPRPP